MTNCLIVLEPKSEPKEPNLQTTPDYLIVIDSDSDDCESPPVKKSHSALTIPESQIPAVCQIEPQAEVKVVPESPPVQAVEPDVQNNVKPDVPVQNDVQPDVPVQKKKVKFLLIENESTSSSDVSPDVSLDTTPKVPPNSPASSNPDLLLTQR